MAQAVQALTHTAPSSDVVDPVPWALLTSSKRDFGDGDGGGSVVTEEHRQQSRQCYRHCKQSGGGRPEPVTPPRPPKSEVHVQMSIEGMCAAKAKNGFSKAAVKSAVASAQEVEVRLAHRVGAPSRRCPE
jgi:hypothetical protein